METSDRRAVVDDLMSFETARAFLQAVVRSHQDSGQTLDSLAAKWQLKRSQLSMYLSGNRELSLSQMNDVARALRMTPEECQRFEWLVLLERSEKPEDKAVYRQRLQTEFEQQNVRVMRTPHKTLISKWYVPALFLTLIEKGSNGQVDESTLEALSNGFAVSREQIEKEIQDLRSQGFLNLQSREGIQLSFEKTASRVSIKSHLKSLLHECIKRIDSHFDSPEHLFQSHSLVLDEASYAELRSELKSLFQKYSGRKLSSKTSEKQVVSIGVQAFPVCKVEGS